MFPFSVKEKAVSTRGSKDKNEDWVSVWYTEIDTYKKDIVDSYYCQNDNRIDKNGKIVYTDFNERALK